MSQEKLDYKKEYKDLYMPKKKPMTINVPEMVFIMVDGKGEPGGEAYQCAMDVLYGLSFTIKMSKMGGNEPAGYFEYVVPPLEGFWWSEGGKLDMESPRSEWQWTSVIRQPEFVTPEVFEWAVGELNRKKPQIQTSIARLESFTEGQCVQMMHIGPYSEEKRSMDLIEGYIQENGLRDVSSDVRKHHEIYLGDPRKTAPKNLRTVLRVPVEKI